MENSNKSTQLVIKNGVIVRCSDPNFVSLSEGRKKYEGNFWTVTIEDGDGNEPGRIICHAEQAGAIGPLTCHKEFRLGDGTLHLGGGDINDRFAHFRSESFQRYLNNRGIKAVRKEDPNQTFESVNPVDNCWSHSLLIETDGEVETLYDKHKHIVTGATYAVVRQRWFDGVRWRTGDGYLYTLKKDVMKLPIKRK